METKSARDADAHREGDLPGAPGDDHVLDRRRQRRWVPTMVGWGAFLIGLLDVIGGLEPEWHHRMFTPRIGSLIPGSVAIARTGMVIVGLLLLLVSHGLRRRKRRAWRAVTGLLALTIVLHVLKG